MNEKGDSMKSNNSSVLKNAGMVDVSAKEVTKRLAMASCRIIMTSETFKTLTEKGSPKGDCFETAKVAGIMAAKSTSSIIPLCHPLNLSKVKVWFELDSRKSSVVVLTEVVCWGQTGVEMEALTAASIASLTIYDMMKWADPSMTIQDLKLLKKTGGKSGNFERKR